MFFFKIRQKFSTQALTNDKVYLLVLYMGDGGVIK